MKHGILEHNKITLNTLKVIMNWFGKKKDSGGSSAPSGGGGGGGGDPSQTIVKLREAVSTQEKRWVGYSAADPAVCDLFRFGGPSLLRGGGPIESVEING